MCDFFDERALGLELDSGERMMGGRITAAAKDIMEKMTSEKEPIRPIAPSLSVIP